MCTASKFLAMVLLGAATQAFAATQALRVCSDPNNLPYSNQQQQGFENQLAQLIAKDLDMRVTYFWFPQRSSFFRKTLNSGVCDVVMGVPAGFSEASTTRPYYRSSYVFISRRDRNLHITSFDDPRLRSLRIGVHVMGEQDDTLPPVHALTSRGIVRNLVGYSIFGNLDEKNPPADLIKAVEENQVDLAVAWGPMAGYFARRSPVPMEITPVESDPAEPELPFCFDIAIGVRKGDSELKNRLDAELARRHTEIEQILRSYGIPQVGTAAQTAQITGD